MRKLILGSVGVVLLASMVATAQAQSSDVAKMLEQMEQRWAEAAKKQDAKPLADMLSDDYLLTITTGQVVDKDSYVSKVKDGTFKIESIEFGKMIVRVHGDCAVAVGRISLKGTWDATDVSGEYAFTDTFVKQGGKWLEVASQVNRIEG